MPLVTPSFFVGEINIVGWETSSVSTRERLCHLIAMREPEFLDKALGVSFALEFTSGVTNNVAKFLRIKNGGTYKHQNGKTYRFNGLAKNADTISAIANYIYYCWCRDSETQSTTLGEASTKTDSASVASANSKAVKAWNVAARECISLWEMLGFAVNEDGSFVYPTFDFSEIDTRELRVINVFGL